MLEYNMERFGFLFTYNFSGSRLAVNSERARKGK